MVKSLLIDPAEVRKASILQLGEIPVNTYSKTLREELDSNSDVTPADCLRIYRDMLLIREFETMLDQIKKQGDYDGVAYKHAGPAHLSIGQEGAAVGECFYLTEKDHIYGSHRSHGEVIAKGLTAINCLSPAVLRTIMESYFDGAILRVIEKNAPSPKQLNVSSNGKALFSSDEEDEQAIDYLLYGLLSEIFGRETGFNKGMGGSMHTFFMPFGIYPNNAIVGGSGDIATGAALYKKVQQQEGIAVANIGDASLGCGPVWEAMQFAAMGQFSNLWEDEYSGGLPMVFNIMNNFYGMGGQPIGETMGYDRIARAGAGINPEKMHAECVDGNNPLAVMDAYKRKIQTIQEGDGPIFLEVMTYRQSGHSPSDQSSYRDREEMERWRQADPLKEFSQQLQDAGVADEAMLEQMANYAKEKVTTACKLATNDDLSPRMTLTPHQGVARMLFSNDIKEELPGLDRDDAVLIPLEENPRVKQIAKKSRKGVDENGKTLKEARAVSFRDGLFEAIIHHFYNDPRLVAYGEENRDWGGAFAVYRGLTESLPYHRLFNSPISEGAIVGTGVGYALEGGRALVELMYCDFLGRAGDEVFNQLSKWQAMSGGYCQMPVVLRVSVGSKYGAQHSQDWTALCAHIPGLKVVFPARPYDAKGMMATALSGSDPVVFFESQRLYDQTEIFAPEGVPAEYYRVPIGEPVVVKEGTDLTIMTYGATLYRAWEAVQRFEKEYGLSVELIDGRSLVPFNYEKLLDSVKKTGRLILGSDACERGSYLQTVAANVTQMGFDYLDAPVAIVGARDWIVPPAELEDAYYPQPSWFLDAYHHQIKPLDGYQPTTDRSADEYLNLSKYDVV